MIRFENFVYAFIGSFVIYVLLIWTGFADTLVSTIFLASIILLIFTREEKVEREVLLKIPKVHYYHTSRINLYGYLMVAGGIISMLAFYLLTFSFKVRFGLSALIIWAIFIAYTWKVIKYTGDKLFKDSVVDFVFISLDQKVELNKIEMAVRELIEEKVDISKDFEIPEYVPEDLRSKFRKSFKDYILDNINPDDELVSEEIEELNKKS